MIKFWLGFLFIFVILFALRLKTNLRPLFNSGTKLKITATLKNEPKKEQGLQTFILSGVKIKTWNFPEYHYGDRLEITGTIRKNNEILFPEKIIIVKRENPGLLNLIVNLRKKIENRFQTFLPEPQGSLLSGIVLGSKTSLPSNFYQKLQKTGTLHLIVASGSNIAMVSAMLMSFSLTFFRRKIALILVFFGIWFYVFLAGGEIPILRAGIMTSFVILAQFVGREAGSIYALILAAAIILLIQTDSYKDIGFQLSFAATLGIILFSKKFENWFRFLPNLVKNDLSQTLSAEIAILPLIFIYFGQISYLAPVVNVLVLPVIPWLLRSGAIIAILGLIFPLLGQLLAWMFLPFLFYFVKIVEMFG